MVSINSKLGRKIKEEEKTSTINDEIDDKINDKPEEIIIDEKINDKPEELSVSNKEYVIKIDDYMAEH